MQLAIISQYRSWALFELLADLTDEDGAAAEMEDLDIVRVWLFADVGVDIPRQTELLDIESLEKLPPPRR